MTPSQVAQQKALQSFVTPSSGGKSSTSKRSRKPSTTRHNELPEAYDLAEFLTKYKTQVTIESRGIKVTMRGFVHVDTSGPLHSMSVLTWGDDSTTLSLPPDPDQMLVIRLEDNRVFNALFVGSSVRLGLRGCLIGFTLIPNDDEESHTADT